jgi:hypothetical protein
MRAEEEVHAMNSEREPEPPIEDEPATAWAIDDDAPVPGLAPPDSGAPDADTPVFSSAADAEPQYRTGAEQPWDPEDLAVAKGWDPTPENIERARQLLAEEGRSAIEKIVP